MVFVQIDLEDELNDKIKVYMIKNKIERKQDAIVQILEKSIK